MDRRNALKSVAVMGAAAAMPACAGTTVGKSSTLKVGLIGCSGRGLSAVDNMLTAAKGRVKIIAAADLFQDRMDLAVKHFDKMSKKHGAAYVDVPKSRQFVGWEAYKELLALDEVDVIIHATPPVFRPLHLRAAVEAGKHMFVEKPACVDPVQARELYEISKIADQKRLSVICGVQRRFHAGYIEAMNRMWDGEIGDIITTQAYWLNSRFFIQNGGKLNLQNPDPESMEYQIRNWFIFRWASGDCYVEQHVHNLDIILWGLNGKKAKEVSGLGGRRWDIPYPELGDRFSHFGVDFDFGDGLHCASYSRRENKAADYVMERFIGTKGILELNLEGGGMARILGTKKPWQSPKGLPQCLVEEHRVLIESILNNEPKNILSEMVDSTVMAIAGREAAYSGQRFKYDFILKKSKQSMAPKEWKFGKNPIPPIPCPGVYRIS